MTDKKRARPDDEESDAQTADADPQPPPPPGDETGQDGGILGPPGTQDGK